MSYAWSTDETEYFGEFASREKAFAAGRAECPDGQPIWTGRMQWVEPGELTEPDLAEPFLEILFDRYAETEQGMADEEGWEVSNAAKTELDEGLRKLTEAWLEKYGPTWFTVTNVEKA